MTLPVSPNSIGVNQVNVELRRAETTANTDLNTLNGYLKTGFRPAQPNLGAFYGLAYFQNNNQGNCTNNGANCSTNCNCNCGNIQCSNCANCATVNCANCDAQEWVQANCNCACTYNCNSNANCYSYNCNCSKIICTKLHEIGLMPQHIFEADQEFGNKLRETDPEVYNGYVRWASVITSAMDGWGPDFMIWIRDAKTRKEAEQASTIKWAKKVATPWSEHMAYLMGVVPEDNNVGRLIMKMGRPLSRLANKLPKNYNFGLVGSYTLWAICPSLYYIATAIDKVQSLFKKNKE